MDVRTLLGLPRLTIVSGEPDFELRQIAHVVEHSVTVDDRAGLEHLLDRLLGHLLAEETAARPRTLDLVGHTRTRASLLAVGEWVIDPASAPTAAWFRALAGRAVLPRLGVHAVRLLGCNTAVTAEGRAAICALGDVLGLEVHGSKQLLHAGHYDADGFRECWDFLLVAASELRREQGEPAARARDPHPFVLDVNALPAIALGSFAARWPRRLASRQAAREILRLVRHREGACMLGVMAPSCELALASAEPHAYHIAHVLLDGEFLRFYPDGMTATGIAFPVEDAGALRQVVAALPANG